MNKNISISNLSNIKGYISISIFILILVGLNPEWNNIGVIWWGTVGLFATIILFNMMKKSIPIANAFTIWSMTFLFISICSYFWSLNYIYSFDRIKTLMVNIGALWLLSCIIQSQKDIIKLLKLILYAITINGVYILSSFDLSLIGKIQIGANVLGDRWNGNAIGIMMSFGMLISMVLIKLTDKRKNKVIYSIIGFFMIIIALFTGSRKAIFFILFGYSIYTILTSKNKRIIILMKVCIVIMTVYSLIMNIPILYNILGIRLEGLIANFTGDGVVDNSTKLRMLYIEYGISWFRTNPVIGYGIDNYRELLFRNIGVATYSHNNYIEILVNLGLIGFIVYYSAYINILKNSIKFAVKYGDILYSFIFTIILTILIGQYGYVVYSDFLTNLILCISFSLINVRRKINNET